MTTCYISHVKCFPYEFTFVLAPVFFGFFFQFFQLSNAMSFNLPLGQLIYPGLNKLKRSTLKLNIDPMFLQVTYISASRCQ